MFPSTVVELNSAELLRYDRQIKLAEFGLQGQLKLKQARILIAGAGGLGNPLALYLAGAGVGIIGIADFDSIDITNLHRQIAFREADAGLAKVEILTAQVRALNPSIGVVAHNLSLTAKNVADIINQYDLVIDGTDSFASRFLLADACYLHSVPLLHGAVYAFRGQIILLPHGEPPCFRCLYAAPPQEQALPSCSEAGILGVVTGAIALIMATEAIKFLAGLKTPSLSTLLNYDALAQSIKLLPVAAQLDCPLCSKNASISTIQDLDLACSDVTQEVSPEQARELMRDGATVVDVREPNEFAEGCLARAISIPLANLTTEATKSLNEESVIVAYCKTGKRSSAAVRTLQKLGFTRAHSILGGIEAWKKKFPLDEDAAKESALDQFLREDR